MNRYDSRSSSSSENSGYAVCGLRATAVLTCWRVGGNRSHAFAFDRRGTHTLTSLPRRAASPWKTTLAVSYFIDSSWRRPRAHVTGSKSRTSLRHHPPLRSRHVAASFTWRRVNSPGVYTFDFFPVAVPGAPAATRPTRHVYT